MTQIIERHKWQPSFQDETWIIDKNNSREFTITLKQDSAEIEIECINNEGTERMWIDVKVLKELIKELE